MASLVVTPHCRLIMTPKAEFPERVKCKLSVCDGDSQKLFQTEFTKSWGQGTPPTHVADFPSEDQTAQLGT